MTWLTIVLNAKKAFVWCKHHWKILALAAWTLVVWIIARGNVRAYKKVLETTVENYKKEIEVLENSHSAELNRRNEAIQAHNRAITRLEEEYRDSISELTVEKRARYLELIEMLSQDPENANRAIEEEFGFKYVE